MKIAFYILWAVAIILAFANMYFLWKSYKKQVEYLERQEKNEYPAINIVNEEDFKLLEEAIEKQKAIKPYKYIAENGNVRKRCFVCGSIVEKLPFFQAKYCPKCGQKIDWSDENELD